MNDLATLSEEAERSNPDAFKRKYVHGKGLTKCASGLPSNIQMSATKTTRQVSEDCVLIVVIVGTD